MFLGLRVQSGYTFISRGKGKEWNHVGGKKEIGNG